MLIAGAILSPFMLSLLIKPFVALALFFVASLLSRFVILPLIPDGRVKRLLTRRAGPN